VNNCKKVEAFCNVCNGVVTMVYLVTVVKKTSQFKTVCKDDSGCITRPKQTGAWPGIFSRGSKIYCAFSPRQYDYTGQITVSGGGVPTTPELSKRICEHLTSVVAGVSGRLDPVTFLRGHGEPWSPRICACPQVASPRFIH